MLALNINIKKAEAENWSSTVPATTIIDQVVYNSNYNIMSWLIKLLLFIFITSVIIYLFYHFKKNNKKKDRIKKVIQLSFGFSIIFIILFWLLFLVAG